MKTSSQSGFVLTILFISFYLTPAAATQELQSLRSSQCLSFSRILSAAAQRPAVRAARARADAAKLDADAVLYSAWLPDIRAQYSFSDRSQDLSLQTPIGQIPLGEGSWKSFGARLTQPLFDPARALYGVPAARSRAAAFNYSARRHREEMAAAAGNAFFDIQVLDARKKSLLKYIKALKKRVAESQALWHGGRILKADFLKVKLAHDNAAQDLLKLQQQRRIATLALGRAIGKSEPIEPAGPAMLATLFPINEDSAAARPEEDERSDLIALNYQITTLDGQAKTLRAAALPRLELQLQWNWSDQEIVNPKSWGEGALVLVWNPLAGGQRLTQAQARSAEARALNETLNEARQGLQLEIAQASAAITVAEGEIALGKTGVEQAKEYQRVIRERFLAGRTTTAHLLEAEAALNQQRTRNFVAAIELQRAHLTYHLAAGDLLSLTDGYNSQ